MKDLTISLKDRSVTGKGGFLYPLSKRFFPLYVLLALERIEPKQDEGGYVDVTRIVELPFWEQNIPLSVGKQISRHISAMEKTGRNVIEFIQKVKGPYRLGLTPDQISFEETLDEARSFLGLFSRSGFNAPGKEESFYEFVQQIWEGDLAFGEGKLEKALRHYEKAASDGVLTENVVVALHKSGRILERLGKYDNAQSAYERAHQILSKSKFNYYLLAENRIFHGWLDYRERKLKEAEKKYREALELIRGRMHYRLSGEIYNGLAKIVEAQGRYTESLSFFQRALSEWVTISYFYGIQACYFNIGNLYKLWADNDLKLNRGKLTDYAKEKYESAIRWAKRCIKFCGRTGIGDDTSEDRILVSYSYYRLGDCEKSIEYALDARRMATDSKNKRDLGASNKRLARAYYAKGDIKKAQTYLTEALSYLSSEEKAELEKLASKLMEKEVSK